MPNSIATTLVVTGGGFDSSSVVLLDGFGALTTTPVSGSTSVLTAALPAGVPIGVYTVRVVNGDGSSASLPNALTIVGPTATPVPTSTPGPTPFVRPQLVVQSYGASSQAIVPASDLDFEMTLLNAGQGTAANVVATFVTGDFLPRVTGGVRAVGTLGAGQSARFFQPLAAASGIAGKSIATLEVKVAYTDPNGTSYSEVFTLTFPVARPPAGPPVTSTPTLTPTPKPVVRPQVLITSYRTDVSPLQPGTLFALQFEVQNLGNDTARRVTMIMGGGSSPPVSGTPGAGSGGVSGAGGEFTNFAPVGASNVQSLGDLGAASKIPVRSTLIVNSSTKPGAYPLKVSFGYVDDRGNAYTDDQVVTLLVYQLPTVEVSFYRDPGPFFLGQPNLAPVQIINIGRSSAVLGNLKVTGASAQFANNVILVGALDPGGFFTLDATVIPQQPGPMELVVSVNYTDDFNQPQVITQTLSVEVMEVPIGPGPGDGGVEPPPPPAETWLQKLWRFIRGLLGLDSGVPSPTSPGEVVPPGDVPPGELPPAGGKG